MPSAPPKRQGLPVLRADPSVLNGEELARLASLDLPSPTEEELHAFTLRMQGNCEEVCESLAVSTTSLGTSVTPPTKASTGGTDAFLTEASDAALVPHGLAASAQHPHRQPSSLGLGGDGLRPRPTSSRARPRTAERLAVHVVNPSAAQTSREITPSDAVAATERDAAYALTLSVLSRQDLVGGPEAVTDAILSTKYVDLIGRQLPTATAVEFFLNATHVYLQYNHLTSLDGLEMLTHLQVLVVHHNKLTSLRAVAALDELIYLDASDNAVEALNPSWDLPCGSLQYLNLRRNPCCPAALGNADTAASRYREAIIASCGKLRILDEEPCREDPEGTSSEENDDEDPQGEEKERETWTSTTKKEAGMPSPSRLSTDSTCRPPMEKEDPALPTTEFVRNRAQERFQQIKHHRQRQKTAAPEVSASRPASDELAPYVDRLTAAQHSRATAWTGTERQQGPAPPSGRRQEHTEWAASLLADAASAQVRRLHEDLAYRTQASQRRQAEMLKEQWNAVDRVVQTRRAVVSERRRRLQDVPAVRSAAYQASLAMLAEEGESRDLDKYRHRAAALPTAGSLLDSDKEIR